MISVLPLGGLLLASCGEERTSAQTPSVSTNGVPLDVGEESSSEPAWTPSSWATRRLTREQLIFTLEDVLDVAVTAEERALLPAEHRTEGFSNTDVGLVVTEAHVEGWMALAESLSGRLDADGFASRWAPCEDLSEAACGAGLTRSLLTALWRRPATDEAVDRYAALFSTAEAEGMAFGEAGLLVLEAVLQSPAFLYHLEDEQLDGDERIVEGADLANRLSYLLWMSAPDEALMNAAVSGALSEPAALAAEVDRMLADPRARRATERYVRDWLALDTLANVERSDLDDTVRDAMVASAVATWQDHVWTDAAPVADALDLARITMPPELAEWYGLAPEGDGLQRYFLDEDGPRLGLLTHPAALTTMADRDVGGIVARGLFLQESVMCQPSLHPPEELDLSAFTNHLGPEATGREYSEDRLADGSCSGCHVQFDPLAWALEVFDGVGRHQTESEYGRPLRSDGFIRTQDGDQAYNNSSDWALLLAGLPEARRCVTARHVQLALGRPLSSADRSAVDAIHADAVAAGGDYSAVMHAVAAHPTFWTVSTEEEAR
ncbi:MAG: DUF1592 domain-containing protein [Myxococcota bacterium]